MTPFASADDMVVLTRLPDQAIIDGFKGQVDFYQWKGRAVARKWPRSPGQQRAPSVEAQWPAFTAAAQEWRELSPFVQDAYYAMAQSSGLSGRDLQVRSYMSGLYRYPLE